MVTRLPPAPGRPRHDLLFDIFFEWPPERLVVLARMVHDIVARPEQNTGSRVMDALLANHAVQQRMDRHLPSLKIHLFHVGFSPLSSPSPTGDAMQRWADYARWVIAISFFLDPRITALFLGFTQLNDAFARAAPSMAFQTKGMDAIEQVFTRLLSAGGDDDDDDDDHRLLPTHWTAVPPSEWSPATPAIGIALLDFKDILYYYNHDPIGGAPLKQEYQTYHHSRWDRVDEAVAKTTAFARGR